MTTFTPDYSHYFWQGERTRLRPFRLEDAELRFIASLDSPTRQLHQDGIELPTSVELQKEWLEKAADFKDDRMIRFAMENLDDITVGWVTLHSTDQKNGTFSFGVAVYRDYRGHGYAIDAVRTLLKYGFWEQRYQKCNSVCVHTNEASIRMHKKLGFIEEGRIRRNSFFNGKYHDDLLFGMTREEFDELMET
ncbi:MAG: GNAT family N-acetyltransferase [Anaerolineae bacterium]|nr:MAG: GNAT family N-acetyltransferase [Anaerolineae bacterium]